MSFKYAAIGVALVVIAIGAYTWFLGGQNTINAAHPSLLSISIMRPDMVVTSTSVARVEIWTVPAGAPDPVLLGFATLATSTSSGVQAWLYPIPAQPIPAAQLFARGFDANGNQAGDIYLSETGAQLQNALWGVQASSAR